MRFAKQENRALVPRVPGKRSHIVSLLYSVFGKKSRGFPIFSPRAGFSRDFTAERAPRFRPRPRPERQKAPKEHPASSARSAVRFRRRSHGECDLPPKEYRGVPASPGGCPCAGRNMPRRNTDCFPFDHNHLFLCTLYHVTSLAFGGVFAKVRSFQTVRMFFICEQKSANKKNLYIFCKYSRIRQNCA